MLANPDRIEAQLLGVAHFCEEVFVVLLFGTILGVVIEES
jgi:H+/gluconate symporter-like permease